MSTKLVTLLGQLAAKLGTTIQYLWGVEVRQAYVDGIANLVWGACFFVLFAAGVWCVIKLWRKVKSLESVESRYRDEEDIGGYYCGVVLVGMASALVLILTVVCGVHAMQHFMNPQNYAFQNILSAITPSSGN